ncbi:hypothetical protein IFM89_001527 [Coptis chinensis]|uniref:BHLH domain-containing protein n=1 Tax=Coptis chinensis TaxID=261450 RepID=A0A835HZU6_9MAGN|nr:hypothetical protein IFM89_001527 [Coptis chinensis]
MLVDMGKAKECGADVVEIRLDYLKDFNPSHHLETIIKQCPLPTLFTYRSVVLYQRSRAAEVHNLSEKRRRSRINEKMKALQNLIPNSNKTDKASMLDEAIEYLKQLQLQVQWLACNIKQKCIIELVTDFDVPSILDFIVTMLPGTACLEVQREQVADAEALLDIANTIVASVKSQNSDGITPSDFITSLLSKFAHQNGELSTENPRDSMAWGTQLFEECLLGILRNKTIIYVTHQVELLPAADLILVMQNGRVAHAGNNYWMAWASPLSPESEPEMGMSYLFLVYILLYVGSSLCVLVRATLIAVVGILTSQKFFTRMLHSVLRAPMSFSDSTPTRRILNRTSTDQSVMDMEIANKVGRCAFSIIRILGTIFLMSQCAWQVFAIFVPVTTVCVWYQRYYAPITRELARFAESLSGAATIRAFDHECRFINTNLGLIDNHSRPWFHSVSAMEWLSFRLNLLSNFVFTFSLVLLVSLPEGIIKLFQQIFTIHP